MAVRWPSESCKKSDLTLFSSLLLSTYQSRWNKRFEVENSRIHIYKTLWPCLRQWLIPIRSCPWFWNKPAVPPVGTGEWGGPSRESGLIADTESRGELGPPVWRPPILGPKFQKLLLSAPGCSWDPGYHQAMLPPSGRKRLLQKPPNSHFICLPHFSFPVFQRWRGLWDWAWPPPR